jgi:hypothetical protein
MTKPLDYAAPADTPRGPWYARVPLIALFLALFLPSLLFGRGGRSFPFEKWRFYEVFLPGVGCPIALTFAALSYATSSRARRIGLLIVIAIAILGICGVALNAIEHW